MGQVSTGGIVMVFGQDKALHFFAGFLIAGLVSSRLGVVGGLSLVVLVAASKEIYDIFGAGTMDGFDFVVTVFGGVVGCICIWLTHKLFLVIIDGSKIEK